jgi:hypothetical protein
MSKTMRLLAASPMVLCALPFLVIALKGDTSAEGRIFCLGLAAFCCWAAWLLMRPSVAERAYDAAMVARADEQHQQVLEGSPEGIYGDYMPPEELR